MEGLLVLRVCSCGGDVCVYSWKWCLCVLVENYDVLDRFFISNNLENLAILLRLVSHGNIRSAFSSFLSSKISRFSRFFIYLSRSQGYWDIKNIFIHIHTLSHFHIQYLSHTHTLDDRFIPANKNKTKTKTKHSTKQTNVCIIHSFFPSFSLFVYYKPENGVEGMCKV